MTAVSVRHPHPDRLAVVDWLNRNQVLKRIVLAMSLVILAVLMLFPFAWMLITSLRTATEMYAIDKNPFGIREITFESYWLLLTRTQFLQWMVNSATVALVSSLLSLIFGLLAAFSLGRLRYAGGGIAALLVFATYLIPPTLLFIPLNFVITQLKLSNSLWSLVLTYQTFMVPFIAWMLSSYFKALPVELTEAARIDGASRLQAMFYIDIPLILPGIVSVFFFAFTLAWNEYIYAFTFIRREASLPVSVGVVNALVRADVFEWGQLMAGALLGSIPVVIVYSFLMDYYLAGLTAGAVKS